MRQALLFIALVVLGIGVYLKFFYDVPDSQETVNFFVSGSLMILGVAGLLVSLFWTSRKSGPADKA